MKIITEEELAVIEHMSAKTDDPSLVDRLIHTIRVQQKALEDICEESQYNSWQTDEHPWDVKGWLEQARRELEKGAAK